jgi:hypothetical protein
MCAMGPEAALVRGRMQRSDMLRTYAELEHVEEFDLYVAACRETGRRGMALLNWAPRRDGLRARFMAAVKARTAPEIEERPLAAMPIARPRTPAAAAPRPIAFVPALRDAPR